MMFLHNVLVLAIASVLSATVWAGAGHTDAHGHQDKPKMDHSTMDHSKMDHGNADHANHQHDLSAPSPAGTPGKADEVSRTIKVDAMDTMMYRHEPLSVKAGETIRFEVTNRGKIAHEFAIGVAAEHFKHQAMMREMPDMKHDDPNVVSLEPGETKTLIWTFAKAADIQVACNIPGHYEAGMHSPVQVD